MTNKQNNCLIIAGEKSGEDHGLTFFQEMKDQCPETHFWGVGGDRLSKLGMELVYHLKDFSAWGWGLDVIFKIPYYLRKEKEFANLARERNTKVAILIDFQGFNLRLAKRLKDQGVAVLYYVAPQAWIWKEWRAGALGERVHTLFTLLPFEKKWFGNRGVRNVVRVNHPVRVSYEKDIKDIPVKTFSNFKKKVRLLILPGSRNKEVNSLLAEFSKVLTEIQQSYNFEVSLVRTYNVDSNCYEPYLHHFDHIYQDDELAIALKKTDICLAASGTVTLTAALFEVPTIVCYKVDLLSEFYVREFIKLNQHVSLINIIHGKEIFPELLQDRMNTYEIKRALLSLLSSKEDYESTVEILKETKELLRGELANVGSYFSQVINQAYNE